MDHSDLAARGVVIAGRYSRTGSPVESAKVIGTEKDLEKMARSIAATSAAFEGAEPLVDESSQVKKKNKPKARKTKVPREYPTVPLSDNVERIDPSQNYGVEPTNPEEFELLEPADASTENTANPNFIKHTISLKKITLRNDFGSMRLKVESVIRNQDKGVMLVFPDDDSLSFIPKIGETLQFAEEGNDFENVFYPGSLFEWTDGKKQVMILFYRPEEVSEDEVE